MGIEAIRVSDPKVIVGLVTKASDDAAAMLRNPYIREYFMHRGPAQASRGFLWLALWSHRVLYGSTTDTEFVDVLVESWYSSPNSQKERDELKALGEECVAAYEAWRKTASPEAVEAWAAERGITEEN